MTQPNQTWLDMYNTCIGMYNTWIDMYNTWIDMYNTWIDMYNTWINISYSTIVQHYLNCGANVLCVAVTINFISLMQ